MTVNVHSTVGGGAFRAWAELRLQTSLVRHAETMSYVQLRITDENGPRGGVDKSGRVVAAVRGCDEPLVVSDKDASEEALVLRLADRLAFAVSKTLDRLKDHSHP